MWFTFDTVLDNAELISLFRIFITFLLFPLISLSQIVPGLPKTRSGKIMRRILRKIASNKYDELGDTSTLADPSVVELIVEKHAKHNGVKA